MKSIQSNFPKTVSLQKSGFTLIELLVVIAVIGFLSSIVLASLRNAGNKGANANVKANLSGIRSQAELVNTTGSYATVCFDPKVQKMYQAAATSGSGNSADGLCNSNASSWAASAPLKIAEGANLYWCVDSTGKSVGEAAALAGNSCP